jgi:hypothetical protein
MIYIRSSMVEEITVGDLVSWVGEFYQVGYTTKEPGGGTELIQMLQTTPTMGIVIEILGDQITVIDPVGTVFILQKMLIPGRLNVWLESRP